MSTLSRRAGVNAAAIAMTVAGAVALLAGSCGTITLSPTQGDGGDGDALSERIGRSRGLV